MARFRWLLPVLLTALVTIPATTWLTLNWSTLTSSSDGLISPLTPRTEVPKPLNAYRISTLADRQYAGQPIKLVELQSETPEVKTYVYTMSTLGKTMSGQLNIPVSVLESTEPTPAILMLRGYVPPEIFKTGVGTKNAAAALAQAGYITVAPDFFGYGLSDPEPADSWQARFEKPIIAAEHLASLTTYGIPVDLTSAQRHDISALGIWAHSNGGQIALTTLEILSQPIPTTLWAPVTVPFPYSILFFSDENDDEGKAMRLWISQFEANYDVFEFSLTKHLDRLTGHIQLHHGTADEAALKVWSDEFVAKVEAENDRRQEVIQDQATATDAAAVTATPLPKIDLKYFTYPGADHNLQPSWNTAMQRDVSFFDQHLQ